MREPAKSCFSCQRALRPGEILYTETAEIVCEACAPAPPPRVAPPDLTWQAALEERRRATQRRWIITGVMFGWMVAGLLVTWRVHARLTLASIDAPAARATVPARTTVRGHVVAEDLHQPIWMVVQSPERCPNDPFYAARVVGRPDGTWESPARFAGRPGQRFLITIVAADELADATLERVAEDGGDAQDRPAPIASAAGPCRPLPGGWLDLPSGSIALASRAVVLGGGPLAARR